MNGLALLIRGAGTRNCSDDGEGKNVGSHTARVAFRVPPRATPRVVRLGPTTLSTVVALVCGVASVACSCDSPAEPPSGPGLLGGRRARGPAPWQRPPDPNDAPVDASRGPVGGWLKGQLHMHTNHSGDSRTPPEIAARWYADLGFDFIVVTDHNVVTDLPDLPTMLTIRGMELTENHRRCEPPAENGAPCLLHMSALFVGNGVDDYDPLRSSAALSRGAIYGHAFDAARASGALAMLNHPNFADGADIDVVMDLASKGMVLLEIENRAVDSENEGRPGRPSTEALWDAALARGARVFGTATDDAHHYEDAEDTRNRGEPAYVGHRGWVMVRAEKNEAAIRRALEAGDFYATTGLLVDSIQNGPEKIEVRVARAATFEVLGPAGVLFTSEGTSLSWDIPSTAERFVRVRVKDAQGRRALLQPIFLAR